MTRNAWLFLVFTAVLAVALPGAVSAAGCCQLRDSCKPTDDEADCTAAGGTHYQLGFCDGKICQPTVAVPPHTTAPAGTTRATFLASLAQSLHAQTSSAGWDCVTKDGSFCWGELGPGNRCVSSTTCTPAQLKECLPGFPMCSQEEQASTTVQED